jgi:hypothetical protein
VRNKEKERRKKGRKKEQKERRREVAKNCTGPTQVNRSKGES